MTYSPNRKHERGDGRMKIQHIACDGATVCKGIRLRSIAKLVAENFSLASVFQHDIRCSRETSIRKTQTDSSLSDEAGGTVLVKTSYSSDKLPPVAQHRQHTSCGGK